MTSLDENNGFAALSWGRDGSVQIHVEPAEGQPTMLHMSPEAAVGFVMAFEAFLRTRIVPYGPFWVWVETRDGECSMVHASDCRGAMEASKNQGLDLDGKEFGIFLNSGVAITK